MAFTSIELGTDQVARRIYEDQISGLPPKRITAALIRKTSEEITSKTGYPRLEAKRMIAKWLGEEHNFTYRGYEAIFEVHCAQTGDYYITALIRKEGHEEFEEIAFAGFGDFGMAIKTVRDRIENEAGR